MKDVQAKPRRACILDLDSPSYGPEESEYKQCGCDLCLSELRRRGWTIRQEWWRWELHVSPELLLDPMAEKHLERTVGNLLATQGGVGRPVVAGQRVRRTSESGVRLVLQGASLRAVR